MCTSQLDISFFFPRRARDRTPSEVVFFTLVISRDTTTGQALRCELTRSLKQLAARVQRERRGERISRLFGSSSLSLSLWLVRGWRNQKHNFNRTSASLTRTNQSFVFSKEQLIIINYRVSLRAANSRDMTCRRTARFAHYRNRRTASDVRYRFATGCATSRSRRSTSRTRTSPGKSCTQQ